MKQPTLFQVERRVVAGNRLPKLPAKLEIVKMGEKVTRRLHGEYLEERVRAWDKAAGRALRARWQGYAPDRKALLRRLMQREWMKKRLLGKPTQMNFSLTRTWTLDQVIERCANNGVSLVRPWRLEMDTPYSWDDGVEMFTITST